MTPVNKHKLSAHLQDCDQNSVKSNQKFCVRSVKSSIRVNAMKCVHVGLIAASLTTETNIVTAS